jgi:hypothetical protein
MPSLFPRVRRRALGLLLSVTIVLSSLIAGAVAATPAAADGTRTFTAADARTATDAFMDAYFVPAPDGVWRNDLTGGVATMWDADYTTEGLCVANEISGGAYRQQLIDLFYGLERMSGDTRTWTETVDGVTRTTTTPYWWYLSAWNDDLLWSVNMAICSYEQTGDRHMLDVAELHARWLLDTQIDNEPGFGTFGMWHNSNSRGDYKDISTTGQVPYIALELAKYFPNRTIRNNATGEDLTYQQYATRTYDWVRSFIQPDGSILNGTNGSQTGFYDNDHYMMNVGLIDDDAAALYRATGDPQYISDAVRVTDWARNRFTLNYQGKQILWPQWTTSDGGNHYNLWVDSDEGINTVAKGIMARGIMHLIEYAGQTQYMRWMEDNAQTAWDNRHLSDNLLYTNWQIPNTLPDKSVSYGNFTGVDLMNRIIKVQEYPSVLNAGFESDDPGTTAPIGWSGYDFGDTANDGASFTEYKGSLAHSGDYILTHYKSTPYRTYTSQSLTGLRDGTYTLSAWARSSGGQTASYLAVKDYAAGAPELTADLRGTGTGDWQHITISNVQVTAGHATIGLYSDAGAGQWTNIDDVQFIPPAVSNPAYTARNFSFEDDAAATPTPANWSTYDFGDPANDAASFAEHKGSLARTGDYILTHYKSTPYRIYTYQTITGLPNGTYNLSAYVRSTGGQTASYMAVKDYGGASELTADLRSTGTGPWTLVTINNVQVTAGQATIGFYSDAGAGQWTNIDDINFAAH